MSISDYGVISIHAPRGGCDPQPPPARGGQGKFQSTHPAGGATRSFPLMPHLCQLFQSTHPAGGATSPCCCLCLSPRLFQSTHPAGGATDPICDIRSAYRFQSTHPAGGATVVDLCLFWYNHISIHAPRGGCDSKTVHFLAHFADIRRKKSHIFRKTKRRFILIGRKCCFLTLFRVRTSREIPVRLHFAAYTRSVSVGK